MKFLSTFLAAAAAVSTASAVTIVFPGQTPVEAGSSYDNTLTFQDENGHDVVVSAEYQTPQTGEPVFTGSAGVRLYGSGLGVMNSPNDGSHTVDNSGWNDRVVFDFGSEEVILNEISLNAFSSWGGGTDITIYFDDGSGWATLTNDFGTSTRDASGFNPGDVAASIWAVGAINPPDAGDGSWDKFKIEALGFSIPEDTPGDPTPVGGQTALMLGMALLGMAGIRRKLGRSAA